MDVSYGGGAYVETGCDGDGGGVAIGAAASAQTSGLSTVTVSRLCIDVIGSGRTAAGQDAILTTSEDVRPATTTPGRHWPVVRTHG